MAARGEPVCPDIVRGPRRNFAGTKNAAPAPAPASGPEETPEGLQLDKSRAQRFFSANPPSMSGANACGTPGDFMPSITQRKTLASAQAGIEHCNTTKSGLGIFESLRTRQKDPPTPPQFNQGRVFFPFSRIVCSSPRPSGMDQEDRSCEFAFAVAQITVVFR